MGNPYGITLDEASLPLGRRGGCVRGLLDEKSVDEIVAKLSPVELEQVIKIVGRSPRGHPSGALEALKGKRNLASPRPPTERPTNPGTERRRRTLP